MSSRRPVLVTGVPRSGTTWLARVLSQAAGAALTGREPMNPRTHQYGLGGTLSAWTRLTVLSPRQDRLLRASYRGLNPFVYSRYGHRQLLAPLPRTRVIVKDPFALLSLPVIVSTTRAQSVLVFRHPAAVLSSYRRMGWTADLAEIESAVPDVMAMLRRQVDLAESMTSPVADEVTMMAWFWAALNTQALHDIEAVGQGVVVAHEDLALGGAPAMRRLFDALDLPWTQDVERSLRAPGDKAEPSSPGATGLHDFDRAPQAVASSWRAQVSAADVENVERIAGATLRELASSPFTLS